VEETEKIFKKDLDAMKIIGLKLIVMNLVDHFCSQIRFPQLTGKIFRRTADISQKFNLEPSFVTFFKSSYEMLSKLAEFENDDMKPKRVCGYCKIDEPRETKGACTWPLEKYGKLLCEDYVHMNCCLGMFAFDNIMNILNKKSDEKIYCDSCGKPTPPYKTFLNVGDIELWKKIQSKYIH